MINFGCSSTLIFKLNSLQKSEVSDQMPPSKAACDLSLTFWKCRLESNMAGKGFRVNRLEVQIKLTKSNLITACQTSD